MSQDIGRAIKVLNVKTIIISLYLYNQSKTTRATVNLYNFYLLKEIYKHSDMVEILNTVNTSW